MRIVLDTNVLVSGLLSPNGAPAEIVRMVAAGYLSLCFDARILAEYGEVLLRPRFGLAPAAVVDLLAQVRAAGQVAASAPWPSALPDPSDAMFLEAAVGGDAACLVTGNLRHFPARYRAGVVVLSPSAFLAAWRAGSRTR
jgi:putative PIN family toxin of toxin-antitoxin system